MTLYVIHSVCFYPHPEVRGSWWRTDRCVALVACPLNECLAKVGQLCKSVTDGRPQRGTHYVRRRIARKLHGKPEVTGMIVTIKENE